MFLQAGLKLLPYCEYTCASYLTKMLRTECFKGQDLARMYLARHELESITIAIIIVSMIITIYDYFRYYC